MGSDLVDVDVLFITAITILVELDIVFDTLMTIAKAMLEIPYPYEQPRNGKHTYRSR